METSREKSENSTIKSLWSFIQTSTLLPYLFNPQLGLASNAFVQPIIKLQNKAIKLARPTNKTSLEESFQYLNILCLPKLYILSVGKFMSSYHNKLLPNHFDDYFILINSNHSCSTRLSTSLLTTCFFPRVNSSSGKCSLISVGPKVWSSIPGCIKSSATFSFKWKLKKHLLCKRYTTMQRRIKAPHHVHVFSHMRDKFVPLSRIQRRKFVCRRY